MAEQIDDDQEKFMKDAVQQFIDAQIDGQEPDMDDFVNKYPEFKHQLRQKISNVLKIDSLFSSLVQTDESDFADTATGDDLAGQKIGAFEIIEMIGRGGMGVVYLARDTKLKRSVAIKSIPVEMQVDSTARLRFRREAELLASLNHPNIAVIHDIIEQDEGPGYLVLEYVPGRTLAEQIAHKPLKLEQILSISRQIANAVAAAHEKGVIHRDIKPSNIKITPDGRVKVLDFGLAKASSRQDKNQGTTVTQPGRVIGTPAYMSPEQARGKPTDKRSDIWSFGCVLYEMLTSRIPFKGETVSDTLANILDQDPDWDILPSEAGPQVRKIISKCLEKNSDKRYQSARQLCQELQDYAASLGGTVLDLKALERSIRRPKVAGLLALCFLVFCLTLYGVIRHIRNVRWANEAIPNIIRLIEEDRCLAAFQLAERAEEYIPNNSTLKQLWSEMSCDYSIITTPPGANISYKEYSDIQGQWLDLGLSPQEDIRFPRGFYRWQIEKEGFETRECVAGGHHGAPKQLNIDLQAEGSLTSGMVLIPAKDLRQHLEGAGNAEATQASAYLIDKYEVTNKQFKEFIDKGGYQRRHYWKPEFVREGSVLSWEQAMSEFRDKTGRLGPSTWEGGTYPKGQEQYPVSGISWFEADAYAEFAGKSLPTIYHWSAAASFPEAAVIIPYSNFEAEGSAPVGSYPGVARNGLYDMAGNVKEWCLNATNDSVGHRHVLGGAWGEQTYMFSSRDTRSEWNRSPINGFRCVRYPDGQDSVPESLFGPVKRRAYRDFARETPVSDELFPSYKELFVYDRTELNAVAEPVNDSSRHWRKEKITFDAAYGGERVIAYLFLPKGIKPPYQTVVHFPGGAAQKNRPFEKLPKSAYTEFIIMSGRALLYPVYKGTYERRTAGNNLMSRPIAHREWTIQLSKDLRRSIDYLETRGDIDNEKIAYYGISWGASLGPIMLAVEDRIKVGILVVGGLWPFPTPPKVDPFDFAPRVRIPVLMVNGREDHFFSYEMCQKPMYKFLGTPEEDKVHIVYPGGHGVMGLFRRQMMGDIIGWLDRYLGPVD
jgi:serine/threonine protein kinase/dienelactone hydrolase